MDAMGCMLLRECTNGVDKVESITRIADEYPDTDFDFVANEFNSMLLSLKQIGVEVFLADSKYFPIGHRGVTILSVITFSKQSIHASPACADECNAS